MDILIALLVGFLWDCIVGDPNWLYHPVQAMGALISRGEKIMRRLFPKREFLGGMLLSLFVLAVSFALPYFLLSWVRSFSKLAYIVLSAFFCGQILAAKSLKNESMRVYSYIKDKDIDNSRRFLSYIVGRDTANLDFAHISKAVVETIAENTSDGVIAPMLYFAIGGAPLAFLYKAVNTLDSMIGYKNEKYLYFGRFAAKCDDVFNYIPASVSGHLMILAAWCIGLNSKNALACFRRDRHNHASPNSAKTESAAAGALGVQLGGNASYFGKLYEKPTIGDALREIEAADIVRMNKLMYATSILSLLLCSAVRVLIILL